MRKSAMLFAGLAVAVLVASGCNAYDKTSFTATLSGANEVPAVTTTATGTFNLTVEGPVADWTLVIGGGGVLQMTAAHIHQGEATENGGIDVFLWDGPTTTTAFTGTLTGSYIAEAVTACTPGCRSGRSFNGITNNASASPSDAYVNVHSVANAGGEIRGQIQ